MESYCSLRYYKLSLMNNTPITWGFLIKVPYLGKVCVMYDVENKVPYMSKFSRDVNFMDNPNLGFLRFYFRGSFVIIA